MGRRDTSRPMAKTPTATQTRHHPRGRRARHASRASTTCCMWAICRCPRRSSAASRARARSSCRRWSAQPARGHRGGRHPGAAAARVRSRPPREAEDRARQRHRARPLQGRRRRGRRCCRASRRRMPDSILVVTVGPGGGRRLVRVPAGRGRLGRASWTRCIDLAVSIGVEGWEGRPVGALFVVGDSNTVMEKSRQLTLNPFQGYSEDEKNIMNPDVRHALHAFAVLDGAFIVREDGVVVAAGRYLNFDEEKDLDVPLGLGARHMAAAGISRDTEAIAIVVSQTSGSVRVFRRGKAALELAPARPTIVTMAARSLPRICRRSAASGIRWPAACARRACLRPRSGWSSRSCIALARRRRRAPTGRREGAPGAFPAGDEVLRPRAVRQGDRGLAAGLRAEAGPGSSTTSPRPTGRSRTPARRSSSTRATCGTRPRRTTAPRSSRRSRQLQKQVGDTGTPPLRRTTTRRRPAEQQHAAAPNRTTTAATESDGYRDDDRSAAAHDDAAASDLQTSRRPRSPRRRRR